MLSKPRFLMLLAGILACLLPAALHAGPHPFFDDLGFIRWRSTWPQAQQEALQSGKPLFIHMTRTDCKDTPFYCQEALRDPDIIRMLDRYFVCYAADYTRLPPDLDQLVKAKGYTQDKTPIQVILTPRREVIDWRVHRQPKAEMLAWLKKCLEDKRLAMTPASIKEAERLGQALQAALTSKDAKRIASTWTALLKLQGYGAQKRHAIDMMDIAESPAREKMRDAARLVRENLYPQALLALEEARQLAEGLPVADDVHQSLQCLKLIESALERERQPASSKQQQTLKTQWQQVMTRFPDNFLTTVAFQKWKAIKPAR